jgi:D-alanyl-lipoteichoic acid acyltransferase DltB (MBOAT superfamily)
MAENLSDFWRRWHISLSNWLRDYLYFSLPGLRTSKFFSYFNLVVTMVIGGLWHGASWNFVIWGALHGFGLVVVRLCQAMFPDKSPAALRYVNIFLTFHFVAFAWIFFRSPDLDTALAVVSRIASLTASLANVTVPLGVVLGIGVVFHYLPKRLYDSAVNLYVRAPFYAQAVALVALALSLRYVVVSGAAPFIYNQF